MNKILLVMGTTTPEMLEEYLQDLTQLKWYIVPIFVFVFYIFYSELKARNYSALLGGFAFWLMDVFNEIWNAWVYDFTGQPVWGTIAAGNSSFQILIGYNIEISFMFFVLGVASCKMLKSSEGFEGINFLDGNKNYLLDPNNMYYKMNIKSKDLTKEEKKIKTKAVLGRIIPAVVGSILACITEIILNAAGLLTWEKSWWQATCPYLLFLIGYCPFFFMAYIVHDLPRKKQLITVGIILGIIIVLIIVTGSMGMLGKQIPLGWPYRIK